MKSCILHIVTLGLVATLPLAAGCSRSESSSSPAATAVPTEAPTIAITGTPQPPASSPAVASASPSASASASASASPSASASAKLAPSASAAARLAASGKPSSSGGPAVASAAPELAPLKPASTQISGKHFTLDVASPGCRVDAPCTMTMRLVTTGEFHVNKEYPYRFTAAPAAGVQFLGTGDANVFTRAAGDFREDGEKAGTMTIRFKPTAAGQASVSGTYKLSVCSASQCEIEAQAVQLAVPVM